MDYDYIQRCEFACKLKLVDYVKFRTTQDIDCLKYLKNDLVCTETAAGPEHTVTSKLQYSRPLYISNPVW